MRIEERASLERLEQIVGDVAHDLNNLLTVILNYASFIAGADTNDRESRSHATKIASSAHRAARLTRQLQLAARPEPVPRPRIGLDAVLAESHGLLALGEASADGARAPDGPR